MRQVNPGPAPDGGVLVPFNFSDASPLIVTNIKASNIVRDAELVIETGFDDPLATLSLGTAAAPGAILSTDKIIPSVVCTFATDENYVASVDETVILTLSPGTSSAGSGYILIHVRRS